MKPNEREFKKQNKSLLKNKIFGISAYGDTEKAVGIENQNLGVFVFR
jgi:hypothetical protein